jgi:TRAP transporter TAXI family solute receptor
LKINRELILGAKLKRVALLPLVVFILAGITAPSHVVADEGQTKVVVRLGTGMQGGGYYDIGGWAATLSGGDNISVYSVETQGSWGSLIELREGRVEFALAQLNAVCKYLNYYMDTTITVVKPFYTEYLHIVVREPFELTGCSGLIGKRVFLGRPKSGTAITANLLMDLMGVSPVQFHVRDASELSDIQRLFKEDSLDVAMHVGTIGNKFISELMESTSCRLFPLDRETIRRITMDIRNERLGITGVGTIPAGTYRGQSFDVNTVAVPVVLVASPNVPPRIVRETSGLIDEAIDSLMITGNQGNMRVLEKAPFLESQYIFDLGLWPSTHVPTLRIIVEIISIFAILLGLFFFLRRYPPRMIRPPRSRALFIILSSAVVICVVCAVAIYSLEHSVNEHFGSPYEAIWSMFLYLTSKLGGRDPITTGGRVFGSIMLIAGSVFLALLTGFFASKMVLNMLERKMGRNQKNHYVILNWSNRALEVVKQIYSSDINSKGKEIILVVSDDPKLNLNELQKTFTDRPSRDAFGSVHFKAGDPCEEHSLEEANILEAKAILIMADIKEEASADEKTLRSLMAIKRIAQKSSAAGIRPHVVVELANIENSLVVESIAGDFPGEIDVVAEGQIKSLLLAQATIIPGLTRFYKDLLRFEDESNELYLVPIPPSAVGKTFAQYAAKVIENEGRQPLIPVGLQRICDNRPMLVSNPKPTHNGTENPFYRLEDGDRLLVMSYNRPDDSDLPEG